MKMANKDNSVSNPSKDLYNKVKLWMTLFRKDYETSTELAEAAANNYDLYEERVQYKIPEWVFEVSAIVKPTV